MLRRLLETSVGARANANRDKGRRRQTLTPVGWQSSKYFFTGGWGKKATYTVVGTSMNNDTTYILPSLEISPKSFVNYFCVMSLAFPLTTTLAFTDDVSVHFLKGEKWSNSKRMLIFLAKVMKS